MSHAAAPAPVFPAIVEQLEGDPWKYFGTPWARCELLSNHVRPSSTVVRFAAQTPAGDRILYAKTFSPRTDTPEELERDRRLLTTEFERTTLAQRAFAATPDLAVARPVACFPDLLAIVTQEAQGVGLHTILKRLALVRTRAARQAAITALERVGKWLRVFQSAIPADPSQRKDHRRYLDTRLCALVKHSEITETDRSATLAFFDDQWARISHEELNPVAAHADLCPANILVAPDGVTVLDLATSVDRPKYLDLTHLYMHLTLAGRRLRLGRELTFDMQRALLEAFEPGLDPRVPLFRLMLLQNVTVYHLFLVQWQPQRQLAQFLRVRQVKQAREWWLQFAGAAA